MSGEYIYEVTYYKGEREIKFFLSTFPEDADMMVEIYKQVYGVNDCSALVVQLEEDQWPNLPG